MAENVVETVGGATVDGDPDAAPIDPARWARVESIFDGALAEAPEDREAFVRSAAGGDEGLVAAVRGLLRADGHAGTVIRDAIGHGSALLDSTETRSGQRVGAYRLVRPIGRGGMGIVYLATRADQQFDKQVALKLLAPGLISGELVRRFRHERQILADLEHPGIARLLDGGTTDDGLPYLVMEYVEGTPIDRYCDANRLGLRDRLRLFGAVCDAVDHAHRHLVVHRDLKPANVLVTGDGDVKLLDFGIAKLVEVGDGPERDVMRTAPYMTPQYASPEQVLGRWIGPASDVYALGMMLYQLVTGCLPYDLAGATPGELERWVCERDPEPPSVAARGLAAEQRPVSPTLLRGDIDAIVARALAKERDVRYPSADALARDLENHLAARPVSALRGSRRYRLAKLLRRRRVPLAVGAVVLALVGAFTARVIHERNKAEQAVDLMVDLYALSEPSGTQRRAQTAEHRDVDDRGDELVERLQSRPALQARLLGAMGRLDHKLGRLDAARTRLERAVALRRVAGEPGLLASALDELALVLAALSAYDEALVLSAEALALRRTAAEEDPVALAESLTNHANLVADVRSDGLDEAESLCREALTLRRSIFGDTHPLVAESLNNLASVLHNRSDLAAAEPYFRQALEMYRAALGDDDPDVAMVLGNLGLLLVDRDQLEEAEEKLRAALRIDQRQLGDLHAYVALDHDNLASALERQRAFEEAVYHRREALRIRRLLLGDGHPDTVESENDLAVLWFRLGHHEQAVTAFEAVLEAWRTAYGEGHQRVAQAHQNLAVALEARGRAEEAEVAFRAALTIGLETLGPEHTRVARTLGSLGMLLYGQGRDEEAESMVRRALRIDEVRHGTSHAATAVSRTRLATILLARGGSSEAEPLLRSALEVQRQSAGTSPTDLADTLNQLGRWSTGDGDLEAAAAYFEEAMGVVDPDSPIGARCRAVTLAGLGRVRWAQGQARRANALLLEAVASSRSVLGPDDRRTVETETLLRQITGSGRTR